MKKVRRSVVAFVLIVFVCLLLVVLSVQAIRRNRLIVNYERLQIGDSKQLVLQALGQPEKIEQCRENGETSHPCKEEYWYYSFMERWIVYLDRDGNVIYKSYAVSY